MAKLLNKEAASYATEKDRFLTDLRRFHENKGTPYRHLPCIDGKEVDLYQLYWIVTAHGGWEKVNSRSGWDELVSLFDISECTANGALAIKQIYLRFLDSYEKIHFLGEEEDGDDNWYNDEEDSRSRRQKAQKITSTVPLVYNQSQHNVGDEHRAALHLSTDVYRKTDYDRLTLSLTSPLPNEQDFAINVCTLLSNEGRHTLKLAKCPRLLDLLLSHAGVHNHDNMKTYMSELYQASRRYDLLAFWNDVCQDRSVRHLMLRYGGGSGGGSREGGEDGGADDLFAGGARVGTQELSGQRILQVATIVRNLSFEEDNALVLARNVTLLRFCLLCCSTQWSNLNQMGFDILGNVASEVVLEEQGESCVTDVMLSTLTSCIASSDRFQVISSLDILNKLCLQEANEEFIGNVLVDQQSVYDQLVTYLSLHDIHLLISTLECLYSLSCLGEASCNTIVRTHGALDALVSLITVEAQSYGPKACILMRVVETVPGTTNATVSHHHPQVQQQQQPQQQVMVATANPSAAATQGGVSVAQLQALTPIRPAQQQQQVTIVSGPTVVHQQQQQQVVRGQLVQVQRPAVNILPLPRHPLPILRPGQQTPMAPGAPRQIVAIQRPQQQQQQVLQTQQPQQVVPAQFTVRPPQAAQQQQQGIRLTAQQPQPLHVQQQQQQSGSQQVQLRVCNDEANRTFCLSWLRATYEAATGCSIQHEIMYKQYLASLHKLGKRDVISAQHYAACVRSLFGGSVGPNKRQLSEGKVDQFFEGVKVRSQPLPLRIPVSANPNSTQPPQAPVAAALVPTPQQQHPTAPTAPQAVLVNHAVAPVRPISTTPIAPCSPILTNLLHRRSPVPGDIKPNELVQRQQVAQTAKPFANAAEQEENGTSVLDGILPKDPQFGKIEDESGYENNGMLAHILEKKQPSVDNHHMVNGVKEVKVEQQPINHFGKLNGGGAEDLVSNSLKRPASAEEPDGATPAKNIMMVANGLVDCDDPILKQDVSLSPAAVQLCHKQVLSTAMQYQPQQVVSVGGGGGGHQLLMKAVSQSNPVQVAVGATGPAMASPKTVIILQPQTKVVSSNGSSAVQPIALPNSPMVNGRGSNGTAREVAPHTPEPSLVQPAQAPQPPQQQQQQPNLAVSPSAGHLPPAAVSTACTTTTGATTTAVAAATSVPKPNPQTPFLCEWQGCMKAFKTPKEVENHAIKVHCPLGHDDIPCLWLRCDGMKRKRFSLMTHIQDRHCHPQLMKLMAVRRVQMATTGKSEVPLPPAPPPHPGYAPNAAYHAIKRHAAEFVNPKALAMGDEKEGPVTKSIRLTSSLILKNLVIYSSLGKKRLKSYESHLSTVALSNVEASRTVSQILFEMADCDESS